MYIYWTKLIIKKKPAVDERKEIDAKVNTQKSNLSQLN